MDTITQGLLGAVTAQLGFRQKIGRDATWVAAAAAVVPDLDIFVAPLLELTGAEVGDLAVSRYHRGLSHSLLMVPVIAAAVTAVWWWFRRRPGARGGADRGQIGSDNGSTAGPGPPSPALLYACCLVAVLSHPLLDWCTSYGTQMLAPVTHTRYAADAVGIIDICYTPILLVTLAVCYVLRKLPGGARRATLIVGWTGFALSVGYLTAGRVMHDVAIRRAEGLIGPNEKILASNAYPGIGTIFLWRTVIETEHRWVVARLRPLGPVRPRQETAAKEDNEWIRRAAELPAAKTFTWFAMGQVCPTYRRLDGRHVVEFHDMRYGRRTDSVRSMWSLRVVFGESGEPAAVSRQRHHRQAGFGETIGEVWRDMWAP